MSDTEHTHSIDLDDYSFDKEIIQSKKVALVDFWAPWCGPCKLIGPIVEEIASEMAGEVVVGRINVDDNPIISGRYKIMSIPTLLIFKEGKIIDQIIGAQPKTEILKHLESAVK